MTPQSHAQQLLLSLYRKVLRRGRRALAPRIEPLPPRMLWSVTPVGGEYLVNSGATGGTQQTPDVVMSAAGTPAYTWATTPGTSTDPAIAIRDDGKYVLVWAISGDIHGQLKNADGSNNGAEFVVNNSTAGTQAHPDVAMSATGEFIVTWDGQGPGDTDGIYARRYNASGVAQGAQFIVNSSTVNAQHHPAVALSSDGSFLITFTDDSSGTNIAAQYFNSSAVGQGAFTIDGESNELDSAVAALPSGGFVVSFSKQISGDNRVYFGRYNGGTAVGSVTAVDASPVGQQTGSSVAADGSGDFVVTWQEDLRDGSGNGIFARRFLANGSADGATFIVNSTTSGDQREPSIAMNASGAAVVVWSGSGTGDSTGIFAQQFTTGSVGGNQAPVNTVPSAQTTPEDTPLVFSSGNGNAISIADADAGSGTMKVGLSVTSGALSLASTTGLTFNTGDGSNDAAIAFTGTISAINNALNGLTFTPAQNAHTSVTLSIATDDQGNTGTGGAQSDSDTVSIGVSSVNDAPVNTVPNTQTTAEDIGLIFSSSNGNQIVVEDVDAGAGGVRVTILVTSGTLTLASVSNLSFTSGDGIADASMIFSGTVADLQAAMDGMLFTPAADFSGQATLSFASNDMGNLGSGGAKTDSDSVLINVTAVNDAPVNALPPSQAVSGGSILNLGSAYGAPISISDVDAGSSQVEVTLSASVGSLTLSTTSGLTFTSGDGNDDATMTFRGAITAINAALDGMAFNPPLILLTNPTIDITTNDLGNTGLGGAQSDSDTLQLGLATGNLAPVIAAPTTQSTNEDGPLGFSTATGNAIQITDADAGANDVQLTLAAENGRITLSNLAGLTFTSGDGANDLSMTLTGSLPALNNALNGLIFSPFANFYGAAQLQIDVNDQGNTGAGGAQTDSAVVNIAVNGVNDAPLHSIPAPQQTDEDTPLVFSSVNGNLISVNDVDALTGALEVSLLADDGALTLAATSGLTFIVGDGAGDVAMKFTGTLADINAALNGLIFMPDTDVNGAGFVRISTDDQGNTGAGGALVDINHVVVTINPVNDAPINTVPGTLTVSEDGTLVLSSGQIAVFDVDADSGVLQVALSANNGKLTLSQTTGLTFTTGDGTLDVSMLFTGTLADINAALDGMTFKPTANVTGTGGVGIVTSDQGNSGSGGTLSDNDGFGIIIDADNDSPVLALPGAQTTAHATSLTLSAGGGKLISISDIDAGSSQLRLTLSAADGVLTLAQTTGLTFTAGDGSADVTIVVTGTLANLNASLDGLTFLPDSGFDGVTQISLKVEDQGNTGTGGNKSASGAIDVTVAADLPPQVTMDSTPLEYTENDPPTLIAASLAVSDGDSPTLDGATIQIIGYIDGEDVLEFVDQNGITGSFNTLSGVLTLSGVAPLADYQAALRSITYRNSSEAPIASSRNIAVVVRDGLAASTVVQRTLNVSPVNDAPTSKPQADVYVREDARSTRLDFVAGASDAEDAASALTFALAGNSNPDLFRSVSFNAGSDELVLSYARNTSGVANLVVRITDTQGAFVDVPFAVHVSPVNDAPFVLVNTGVVAEQSAAVVIGADKLEIGDVDNSASEISIMLTTAPAHGTLMLDGVALGVSDRFTQADIAAGRVSYVPGGDEAAADHFAFTASDPSQSAVEGVIFAVEISAGGGGPVVPPPVDPPPVVPPPTDQTPDPEIPSTSSTSPPVVSTPAEPIIDTETRPDEDSPAPVITPPSPVTVAPASTPSGGGGAPAEGGAPSPAAPVEAAPAPVAPPAAKPEIANVEAPARAEPIRAPQPLAAAPPPAIAAPRVAPPPPARPTVPTPQQIQIEAQKIAFVAAPQAELQQDLEEMHEQVESEGKVVKFVAGSASFMSVGLSVLYILWTIRGGYLLASLLSSMPAWRLIDPLPILDHFDDNTDKRRRKNGGEEDDESLESLAEGSAGHDQAVGSVT